MGGIKNIKQINIYISFSKLDYFELIISYVTKPTNMTSENFNITFWTQTAVAPLMHELIQEFQG